MDDQKIVEDEQKIVEDELAMWGKALGIAHQKEANKNNSITINKINWCLNNISITKNNCATWYSTKNNKQQKSSVITHIINMTIIENTEEHYSIDTYIGVRTYNGTVYINRYGKKPSNINSLSVPTIDITEENGVFLPNPLVDFK